VLATGKKNQSNHKMQKGVKSMVNEKIL